MRVVSLTFGGVGAGFGSEKWRRLGVDFRLDLPNGFWRPEVGDGNGDKAGEDTDIGGSEVGDGDVGVVESNSDVGKL